MVAMSENGWPALEELKSDEAQLIRRALDSLGHQQLEIMGSLNGVTVRLDGIESRISEAVTDIRAEQRSEFKGVRHQLGANHRAIESLNERIGVVGQAANDTREIVDSMRKVLKQLQVSDRFVSAPPPPPSETPSIPPPLTLGDHVDWKRTPMGGIKLDQKDQALLAQRMAKLEEERRVADAVAKERADIIAAQKREAEEKRLADERKAEADRLVAENKAELDLKKSAERRAWLAAYVTAGVAAGGGVVWLVQALTHH